MNKLSIWRIFSLIIVISPFFGLKAFGNSYILDNLNIVNRAKWGANESRRDYIPKPIKTGEVVEYKPENESPYQKKFKFAEQYIVEAFSIEFTLDNIIRKNGLGGWLKWPISIKKDKRKIIIHHTADSYAPINTTGDEIKVVQGIYKFHTFSKEWGDIGYNYIIGPLGTIYEGRAGGPSAVGAHASRNNTQSIGIALLGNFDLEKPTIKQIEALKSLVVGLGKAYSINPLNEVTYHQFNANLKEPYLVHPKHNTIVGHTDVGSTACPGKNLYILLPNIKGYVAQQLGYIKKSPEIVIPKKSTITAPMAPTKTPLIIRKKAQKEGTK